MFWFRFLFCFWRWPGHLKPRDDASLSGHVDVLPTLAELVGVKLPKSVRDRLEGISLARRLADPAAPWPDRMLFQHVSRWGIGLADEHRHVNCGVRWRNWHLLQSRTCGLGCLGECKIFRRATEGEPMNYTDNPRYHYAQTTADRWALYDLSADPAQDRDVAETNPDVVSRMAEAYEAWWEKVPPTMINEEADAARTDVRAKSLRAKP